jgi:hypothetical protein
VVSHEGIGAGASASARTSQPGCAPSCQGPSASSRTHCQTPSMPSLQTALTFGFNTADTIQPEVQSALAALCGRPWVGQYDRTASGPPDGRERSSAWQTKAQLLVRRRAASACVDLSGRSPPRQHPKATARRAGQRRRATARRERSHAQARPRLRAGRAWRAPTRCPVRAPWHMSCQQLHRRSPHDAASSRARPTADHHGAQALLVSSMVRRSQRPRLAQCADVRWETPVSRALMSGLVFAA